MGIDKVCFEQKYENYQNFYLFFFFFFFCFFFFFFLLVKLSVYLNSLKTLLQQGLSELEFYGDLVYRFRKIVGKSNFSEQFRQLINRYNRFVFVMRNAYV